MTSTEFPPCVFRQMSEQQQQMQAHMERELRSSNSGTQGLRGDTWGGGALTLSNLNITVDYLRFLKTYVLSFFIFDKIGILS